MEQVGCRVVYVALYSVRTVPSLRVRVIGMKIF